MTSIIVISIIIINLFSLFILFNMLKGMEVKFRIIVTLLLILINFILANLIFGIGQAGIAGEFSGPVRNLLVFSILPVNLILMASPLAIQINKLKSLDIEKDKFMKNIIICIVIDIVLIIVECNYVKGVVTGIVNLQNSK